jgi:nicotinamidase-related amidase
MLSDSMSDAALSNAEPLDRSTELMNADDTALLVVDVQERLVPLVANSRRVIWNCRRLLDGAAALGVPVGATEQYPEKLGTTVEPLRSRLAERAAKLAFSGGCCGQVFQPWRERGIFRVLLCGIETHVCIQQTAFDLMAAGLSVYVAADAVSARHAVDHEFALRRMESGGAVVTTTESALFEWCREAGTEPFKQIMALAKESPPVE